MECRKCRGLMIEEWLADELDEAYVWRCVNCGSVMDQMIARHHHHGCAMSAVPCAKP